MQVHQTDFSKGSVKRNIMEVAIPMVAAQLLNLLYNIVDRIYIGMIPEVGQLALGGLGLCFPIIMMVTAFTNLFGGAAPLCGIARGAGDEEEAERIMGNAFAMLLVSGVVLMTVGLVFHKPILYLFGASDVTYQYAADYMTIYLLGTIPVMIALGMNPYINSQGFARIGMLTVFLVTYSTFSILINSSDMVACASLDNMRHNCVCHDKSWAGVPLDAKP